MSIKSLAKTLGKTAACGKALRELGLSENADKKVVLREFHKAFNESEKSAKVFRTDVRKVIEFAFVLVEYFGMSQEEVGAEVGYSQGWISTGLKWRKLGYEGQHFIPALPPPASPPPKLLETNKPVEKIAGVVVTSDPTVRTPNGEKIDVRAFKGKAAEQLAAAMAGTCDAPEVVGDAPVEPPTKPVVDEPPADEQFAEVEGRPVRVVPDEPIKPMGAVPLELANAFVEYAIACRASTAALTSGDKGANKLLDVTVAAEKNFHIVAHKLTFGEVVDEQPAKSPEEISDANLSEWKRETARMWDNLTAADKENGRVWFVKSYYPSYLKGKVVSTAAHKPHSFSQAKGKAA